MARILIFEDHDMNRAMLARCLAREKHEVVEATDGIEGVAAAQSHLPDVIVMDVSLPRLDGLGATRQLKAGEATRHIPIVIVTAHAHADDRARALEAGADEFETKPINLPRFIKLVSSLSEGI